MSANETAIAGVFPQPNEEQWRRLVDKALKGGSFDSLISKTYDGVAIAPLYARATTQSPRALRRTPGRWSILGRVDLADADAANKFALEDLEGGADGLHIVFAGSQGAYGAGLTNDSDETIAHLLANIRLDYGVPVLIEASPRAPNAVGAVMRYVDSHHIEPSITRISFGLDPLGLQALHGFAPAPWREGAKTFAEAAKTIAKAGFANGAVVADARAIHAAGGSETQELAFALSAGVAYLRALTDNGLDIETARSLIALRFAADADEFLGVAKFRAARRLWARIEEACGLAPKPVLIFAETAWRMMSRRDPWNNILRGTLATFSAAIGGADTITVLPFTQAFGAADGFARRLARDTQLVLQDESHIDVVDDPTSGAGGFEALTQEICERAWAAFQEIEAEGGLAAALEKGAFQGRVAATAGERAKKVARSREKVIGANEFPDIHEKALDIAAPYDASRLGADAPAGALKSAPLAPHRLAEPFERLRDNSDAFAEKTGSRPKVFLANLGSVAAFTARANYAKNFFEAGGIEAVFGPETESAAGVVDAFRASGAKLACLCSSDKIYADAAEPAATALKAAGAKLYSAGRPGEMEQKLRNSGVTEFIYVGCDMYDVLQRALEEAK
ncbi:methylmalonyl-CoA mutase subunit beta [Methylocystis sp. MJC1]|jgi:methylmalonyl-CoA mutase|uniref:methylmalonyl-CoA mutase subunit beta n=1 Tax=Methylocystis sp. MJC1 TaxID=2654282 RepID=UPI0013EB8337|nr:methylmalonyl-CoA mutase subunit beta [Methylocystis sp. MJC1]MBU6528610.1 methylmalonyl-CoA mutase subunit beta [Methylocystis sp. MJC1]UZX11503.1 methylmalonyl-CoA mutase subunit beta [Methylocystis sp. MJC1]